MIDRNTFKQSILVQIPFWIGYIAGKTEKIIWTIMFGIIATIVVIVIEEGEEK